MTLAELRAERERREGAWAMAMFSKGDGMEFTMKTTRFEHLDHATGALYSIESNGKACTAHVATARRVRLLATDVPFERARSLCMADATRRTYAGVDANGAPVSAETTGE